MHRSSDDPHAQTRDPCNYCRRPWERCTYAQRVDLRMGGADGSLMTAAIAECRDACVENRELHARPAPEKTTVMTEFWVLHSPYSDGTWRGVEKCVCYADETVAGTGPLLFDSLEDAQSWARTYELGMYRPVRVRLETPRVRGATSTSEAGEA